MATNIVVVNLEEEEDMPVTSLSSPTDSSSVDRLRFIHVLREGVIVASRSQCLRILLLDWPWNDLEVHGIVAKVVVVMGIKTAQRSLVTGVVVDRGVTRLLV